MTYNANHNTIDYLEVLSDDDMAALTWWANAMRQQTMDRGSASVGGVLNGPGERIPFLATTEQYEVPRRAVRPALSIVFEDTKQAANITWDVDAAFMIHEDRLFVTGSRKVIGHPGIETRLRILANMGREAASRSFAGLVGLTPRENSGRQVHDIMGDFLKTVIRRKVLRVTSYPPQESNFKPFRPILETTAPAFDFADMTSNVKFSGDTMVEFATQRGQVLPLPYPECFFIFSALPNSPENMTDDTLIFLHHLTSSSDGVVTCHVYNRTLLNPNQWIERPFVLTWAADDRPDHTILVQAPQHEDELAKSAFLCRLRTAAAAWVLDHPPAIRRQEYHAVRIPRAVTLGSRKHSNIPAVIVIRHDREVIERYTDSHAGPGASAGMAKSPHDRRGHFRKLRDGRVIRIRPSKIHGGVKETQRYEVLTKPA